jgi:hypothetical protein
VYRENEQTGFVGNFLGSLQNALIIIGQVVVWTLIILCLFKYGKIKVSMYNINQGTLGVMLSAKIFRF